MSGVLGFYNYVSDSGSSYVIQLDDSNSLAVGNTVATPGGTGLPKQHISPRYLTCQAPNPVAGKAPLRRNIVVGDPTGAIWTNPPDTISLAVVGAVATAFAVTGAVGERRTDLGQF
jgi:hypothetical protein